MRERVRAIFFRLDVRDEGFLGRAEVEKLLGEMQMEMIQDDAPPTELAVNWVMRVADSGGNGKLDVNDCEKAIKLYAHYLRTKDQVDRIFAAYDADGDDKLSREEMKRYCAAELNDGDDPTDEELDWIIAQCDVGGMTSVAGDGYIGRTEILAVSGEWAFRPASVRPADGPVQYVSDEEEEEDEESKPPGCTCAVQ